MPAGLALVVTRLKPMFFTSETDQLSPISNPYAMVGQSPGEIIHQFYIDVEGSTVGEFGVQHVSLSIDGPGLFIQEDVNTLLGWQMNHYAAYVRGGGKLKIVSQTINDIVIGVGNTIPTQVGMEVGGFKCPETLLKEVLGQIQS